MIANYKIELVAVLAILVFVVVLLFINSGGNHKFIGSDDAGSQKISELTGNPIDSFVPIIPQYKPSNGEIETTFFVLQAAIGSFILGIIFGYWLAKKRSTRGQGD